MLIRASICCVAPLILICLIYPPEKVQAEDHKHTTEKPWWLGSTEGESEEVPPPWTPLKIEQNPDSIDVYPWGRKYRFRSFVFPDEIDANGHSILSRPMRVIARVDGSIQHWQAKSISLDENTPGEIVISQEADGGDLLLSARTQVEYDGVIRIDWKLEPRRPIQLDQLIFEIALHQKNAQYYYHFPGTWGKPDAGTLPAKEFVISAPLKGQDKKTYGNIVGFRPFIWLGDDDRGLAWFSESDKNWYAKKGAKVTEIITEDDTVVLRLHLVSKPLKLSPEGESSEHDWMIPPWRAPLANLTYTFGLQATPVKPITKDVWDYRLTHIDRDTIGPVDMRLKVPDSVLDKYASLGVRTIAFHWYWTDTASYFATEYGEDLKRLVDACHERGIQFIPYVGFQISDLTPEWLDLGEQCITIPMYGGYRPYQLDPHPEQSAYTVCYKSVWQDAAVAGIAKLIDQYGIDGVYLDGTELPHACVNRAHGCGYFRPGGKVALTYPIFAVRDLMRRIYVVIKQRNPDGQVNVHNSTCMTIPTLGFATSYWDGEQFGKNFAPGTFALDALPLDAFRTEFMGRQWGVPAEFLSRRGAPFARHDAYAFTLLHDVLIREGYENCPPGIAAEDALELQSRLWKLDDAFGRKQARWLPYWKNADYVTVEPEGGYASLYQHATNGVLALISNLSRDTATLDVQLNLDKLGLTGNDVVAFDALTNEPIAFSDGRIQMSLPSLGWRLVWLRP